MSQEINLFQPTKKTHKLTFGGAEMVIIVLMLTLGLSMYSAVVLNEQYSLKSQVGHLDAESITLTNRRDEVNQQLAQHTNIDINQEIQKIEHLLANRKEILDKLQADMFDSGEGYSGYFVAFARQHIPGIWLTGVTIARAGRDLSIRGQTTTAHLVPRYLEKLSTEALLSGTDLSDFQLDRPIEDEKRQKRSEYINFIVSTEPDNAGLL